jgi:lipoprotein-anchoring transpeptidase ErfK/SrfK
MLRTLTYGLSPLTLALALAGCSPGAPQTGKTQTPAKAAAPGAAPITAVSVGAGAPAAGPNGAALDAKIQAALAEPPMTGQQQAAAQAIDAAPLTAPDAARPAYDASILRAEVLLDRAGFSPGAIDGRDGDNFRRALGAYADAHGLSSSGREVAKDPTVLAALAMADPGAAMQAYRLTTEDVTGPFIGDPPKDYREMAKLPALGYASPAQLLAEKFHMDEGLLKALNPNMDFSRPGQVIMVAAPRAGPRSLQVGRVEVDKTDGGVRVYDPAGTLTAFYPASVGSAERPAPSGRLVVQAVTPQPAAWFDPRRLTVTPQRARGRLKIAPGPNNPMGSTRIALSAPSCPIHGTPDPEQIGQRQPHGCVRLTNWDAAELGKAVKPGVQVTFVGVDSSLLAQN